MSLTKVSYSMINGAYANVLDFGADPTGTSDSANAFILAIATGKPVYVAPGTYLINSPIATDSSPAYNFYMMGASEAHQGYTTTGTGQCVINLTNNTQYFACIGYDSTIKNINFQNGADVIHHTSSGTDGNTTKLVDVFANNFSGTFFKGVSPGNGSHISWVRPVIVTSNVNATIYDSVTMGGGGFDNLYITDGWIESACNLSFKILSGRFSVNATRFIPYTNANSIWFEVYGSVGMYLMDNDFGGESSRKIIYWGYAGGSIDIKNCGLFGTTSTSYAITIALPPTTITLDNVSMSTDPGTMLYFDPNMSNANITLLENTNFVLGNISPNIVQNLVNVDMLPGTAIVAQAFIGKQDGYVSVSDLVGNGGYPYITSSFGPNISITNGVTNVFGGGTYGESFTSSAAAGYGYQYYNSGPGISSLPNGFLTMEAVVSCNADCFLTFYFGDTTKTFLVSVGNHRICLPSFFISTTTRQIGISYVIPNVYTLSVSEICVFKGNYTSRKQEVYGSAAPTSSSYLWDKGTVVINNNPTVGQPQSWVCTVTGAPGTWVSQGNL